jgi:hypothetical protein
MTTTPTPTLTPRQLLRFCACCPNPCRRAMPADAPRQAETVTPSALALIALAVIDGHLPFNADARRVLQHTEQARACRAACPYDHDIAGTIDALVAQQEARHAGAS